MPVTKSIVRAPSLKALALAIGCCFAVGAHATELPQSSIAMDGLQAADLPHLNLAVDTLHAAKTHRLAAAQRAQRSPAAKLGNAGDLFFQDFNSVCAMGAPAAPYLPPAGWTMHNVDGRTPNSATAWVSAAWVVRERIAIDSVNNNDCAMWSTSWYSPTGAADDWAVLPVPITPTSVTRMSWNATAYEAGFADGYEVRYSTAGTAPADFLANPPLFTIPSENVAWTPREISLAALAGTPVRLAFRNNSNDRNLLGIDDIRVFNVAQFDPELTPLNDVTSSGGYAKLPAGLGYGFALIGDVRNSGSAALSGLSVEFVLALDGTDIDTLELNSFASLAPGQSRNIMAGPYGYRELAESFQLPEQGAWSVRATVTSAEGDEIPANSTATISLATVTANELSRAQGESTISLGLGNGGELGQDFELPRGGRLTEVRYRLNNSDVLPDDGMGNFGDGVADFNGRTLEVVVLGWNQVANEPGDLLATASFTVPMNAPIGSTELEFPLGSPLDLGPGRYLIAAVEPTLPTPIRLRVEATPERFREGTVWIRPVTNPPIGWVNIESNGPEFALSFQMTAILEPRPALIFANGFEN